MMRMFALVAVFLLTSFSVHAEQACTQMWCVEGTTLELKASYWPAGSYTFVIKADDKTVTCQSSLPFRNCDGSTSCDGEGVMIGESGCALPESAHNFHQIMINGTPSKVSVEISHEGKRSFTIDTRLEKQCSFPNGPMCDTKPCCSASKTLNINWKEE